MVSGLLPPIPPVRPIPVNLPAEWFSPLFAQAVLFIALLLLASAMDLRKRIIPDSICMLTALTGLICFSPVNLFGILAALPLLIAAVRKQDSIGGGDVKLTAASGLVLGFEGGITGLVLGLAAALLFHAGRRIAGRPRGRGMSGAAALPLAPFLSAGFITAYFMDRIFIY